MIPARRFVLGCVTEVLVTGRVVRTIMIRAWLNRRDVKRRSREAAKGTVRVTTARALTQVPDRTAGVAPLPVKEVKEAAKAATAAPRAAAEGMMDEGRVVATDRLLVPHLFADIGRQGIASTASHAAMPILMKFGLTPINSRRRKAVGANPAAREEKEGIDGRRREAPVEILARPVVMNGVLLRRSAKKAPRAAGRA